MGEKFNIDHKEANKKYKYIRSSFVRYLRKISRTQNLCFLLTISRCFLLRRRMTSRSKNACKAGMSSAVLQPRSKRPASDCKRPYGNRWWYPVVSVAHWNVLTIVIILLLRSRQFASFNWGKNRRDCINTPVVSFSCHNNLEVKDNFKIKPCYIQGQFSSFYGITF